MNEQETKVCPVCAETIKAVARRCPYCQKRQKRWIHLTSDISLMLFSVALVLACFAMVLHLLKRGRDFSPYRKQVAVLDSQTMEVMSDYSTNLNLIVFGILTNRGSYKWQIGDFEVRFFDKEGTLVDVATASEHFTLLPHSEHAFRLSLYNRRLNPLHTSVKAYVRSARDPDEW